MKLKPLTTSSFFARKGREKATSSILKCVSVNKNIKKSKKYCPFYFMLLKNQSLSHFFPKIIVKDIPWNTPVLLGHGMGLYPGNNVNRIFPKAIICSNQTLFTVSDDFLSSIYVGIDTPVVNSIHCLKNSFLNEIN